jgi:hypothetical protein
VQNVSTMPLCCWWARAKQSLRCITRGSRTMDGRAAII